MGKGLAMIPNDDRAGFSPSFPTIKATLPIHCWKHLLNMTLNKVIRKAPDIKGKDE